MEHKEVTVSVVVIGYYTKTCTNCTEQEAIDMTVDEALEQSSQVLEDVTTDDMEVFIRD